MQKQNNQIYFKLKNLIAEQKVLKNPSTKSTKISK